MSRAGTSESTEKTQNPRFDSATIADGVLGLSLAIG
jgi:hypothetical protein